MARQKKTSVDYFPHVTEHGSTMYILESRWGNDGYAAWFKTLEKIGAADGMCLDCRNFAVWQCLVAYTRTPESVLIEILDTVAKIGKIDAELWQYKILFCQKLVDGVTDAFRRRAGVLPTKEKVIKSSGINLTGKPTEDCPLNEPNRQLNDQSTVISTERESKGKGKGKVKEITPTPSGNENQAVLVEQSKLSITDIHFIHNASFGIRMPGGCNEMASFICEKFSASAIKEAFEIAATNNKTNIAYVRGILMGNGKQKTASRPMTFADSAEIRAQEQHDAFVEGR